MKRLLVLICPPGSCLHAQTPGELPPRDAVRRVRPFLESTSPWVARCGIQTPQLAQRMVLALRQLADTGVVATP